MMMPSNRRLCQHTMHHKKVKQEEVQPKAKSKTRAQAKAPVKEDVTEQEEARPKAKSKTKKLDATAQLVESLMGRKPELRYAFIQEHAQFVKEIDV